MVSSRSTIIIAGALFVSPLAVAAFRTPSSSGAVHPPTSGRCRLNASVLSDSLDADGQQLRSGGNANANDIISRAVEHHSQAKTNGVNGVVAVEGHTNGVDIEFEKHQLQQQMQAPSQRQKKKQQHQRDNINKSRKNNKAMAEPDFLRKRTETLLRMTKDSDSSSDNLSTNKGAGTLKVEKNTFDWLIDAWSYSGEDDAVDNALSLLSRMEELRDQNTISPSVSPDVKSYTKAINAIARSGRSDAGEQAEVLLERMILDAGTYRNLRPNTFTYTYVIDAHSRSASSKSPHAAQRLIEEMERLRAEGDPEVRPTTRAWNSVIAAWAQWKGEEMAWGRIGSGADRAEACLGIMEELANTTGNEEVRPNTYNYNSVISALANSWDHGAPSRAEKILEQMETLHRTSGDDNVKPRTATFNAIIDAWAKSGEPDAADRAELLLAHMMELYQTGHNLDAKPNVRSFNSVLNAWAKSGQDVAPERACEVLTQMEELDASSELEVSPDATSFATTINAFARSKAFGKAQSAHDLFLHMKELHDTSGKSTLRPNNVVYNSVLNACAFSVGDIKEQAQAMEIASALLVELQKSPYGNKPDQVTYGTYMKVINNQMPVSEARDKVVDTVFQKCAKDGMVGEMVLRQLREMGMEEACESLVGKTMWGRAINISDLPRELTCNVIEGKRMRRWQSQHGR
mmetsp:Transcript_3386/g.7469  ORF Transcript_3386/g.7469 Transcript_3386/m.7469 type:complete len:686 (-) Transcript_3386:1196-3253(-)